MTAITDEQINSTLRHIGKYAISAIVAPTGSGKSTTIVQAISKQAPSVFVVEPTVAACISLQRRMQKTMGTDNVGLAAEGNVRYVNSKLDLIRGKVDKGTTPLVYCTSGHMRRVFLDLMKILTDGSTGVKDLAFCDVLVLDEAHSGSLDTEMIMAMWKLSFEAGASLPRLVLASATLTTDVPTHTIGLPSYPITVEYTREDLPLEGQQRYKEVAKVVLSKHAVSEPTSGDSWLVFCPGRREIDFLRDELVKAEAENLIVITLHSESSPAELEEALEAPPEGIRKVIVASNVAEMSITINSLSGVFDTLTERVGETSINGGSRLALKYISQASGDQRKGRTGRTGPGFCYRLCTPEFFSKLETQRSSEITRVPLHGLIIETMNAKLDPRVLYRDSAGDRIDSSMYLLERLGMVLGKEVTELGKFAASLPLSIRSSAILWHWIASRKPLFPCICVIVLLDAYGPSYFFYPRLDKKDPEFYAKTQAHEEKFFKPYVGGSDMETLLNMFKAVTNRLRTIQPRYGKLGQITQELSLNNRKVNEAITLARQVVNRLLEMGHNIELGNFNSANVVAHLSPILEKVYSDRKLTKRGSHYVDRKGVRYQGDRRGVLSKAYTPKILALLTVELADGPRVMRIVSISHPSR